MIKKSIHQLTLFGGLILIAMVLAACQPIETSPDPQLIETYVAQTLAAHQTQTSLEDIPTVTPTPTNTPEPAATEEPTPTPTLDLSEDDRCNQAAFVADITIEDRTVIPKGGYFTKTWRLENTGTCAWTTDYQVIFSSGSQMSAPAASRLPHLVQPGETVDISLNMIAPDSSGTFTGYWLLLNDRGQAFGIGEDADSPFWVRIRVVDEDVTIVYNFAENYCDASWVSSVTDDIDCPGEEDLDEGFIQFTDQPRLEDGVVYAEPAILTYPDHGRSGYLVGRFPLIEIEDGYHFRATIGCQFGAENCDVRYTLRVYEPSFGHTTLGEWREVYEGRYYPIDVDLSDFAGMEVSIVLSAIAQDDSRENYALWLDPHIVMDGKVPQTGPSPIDVEDDEYVALYHLADRYCHAGWESSVVDQIQCPSSEDLDHGFVQVVDRPRLEDGKIYQDSAILTYPDHGRSGYMVGRFPKLTIQEGDLFRAALGCQFGAGACDIRYTLRAVLTPGGGLDTLGQWRIVYNGSVYHAEVDLSDYAGEEIELVLSVIAQDDSRENYALWVNPRVLREISD
jgi:hypothetical protein